MNFASDNVFGVHERIMNALVAANAGTAASYGVDACTRAAEDRLSEVFERRVWSFFLLTGTAANALALSQLVPPYGAVFAHADAHVMVDECGAPELFTGGAKLIGIAEPGGQDHAGGDRPDDRRLHPRRARSEASRRVDCTRQPSSAPSTRRRDRQDGRAVPGERHEAAYGRRPLRQCRRRAWAAPRRTSPGGPASTPCPSAAPRTVPLALEAVIFFTEELADGFTYRRMRGGQLLSKGAFSVPRCWPISRVTCG